MNLDDFKQFPILDRGDLLAEIEGLPGQLQEAWERGETQVLPEWRGIRQVVIAGMGGSAIGADLLAAYSAGLSQTHISVHRDYGIPRWAFGLETLVIAVSHSGETEETLSAFEQADKQGCRRMVLSTGGKLVQSARQANAPAWIFSHSGQPRAAIGYFFAMLAVVLTRLDLLPDIRNELNEAVGVMTAQQVLLRADIPAARNPAKRMAGQLVGRWVTVIGSDYLAPVARRWKGQINEVAKAQAAFEFLPEADHCTLAGTLNPDELQTRSMVLFLQSAADYPRNRLRADLTRNRFMIEGLNTDAIEARGETPLANIWALTHFGDYLAYYLAMAYDVDPTPVPAIKSLKMELQG